CGRRERGASGHGDPRREARAVQESAARLPRGADERRSRAARSAGGTPGQEGARVIGVLGAGQLGRMLALAGIPLGETFAFLHPQESASVRGLGELVVAKYDELAQLAELGKRARVVTYEFESVPAEPVRWLAERAVVHPPPRALEVSQDRLVEKTFFESLGIPTAAFAAVDDEKSLETAVARIGLPAFLKTRRGGYDGKGQ